MDAQSKKDPDLDLTCMTSKELRELARDSSYAVASLVEKLESEEGLAKSYIQCAADQLDQGNYTHALQLVRRAGEVCAAYRPLHKALGGSP